MKLLCFVIVGALAGLAASILIGWVHGVSRGYGPGYELDVIAVVGGTNLFGGIGSVFGTFLGAAITGMITTGWCCSAPSKTASRSPKARSSSWRCCSTLPCAAGKGCRFIAG